MKRTVVLCMIFILLVQSAILGGCTNKPDDTLKEGEYNVYYLSSNSKKLQPIKYTPIAIDENGLVEELMTQFRMPPQDVDVTLPMNSKVTFMGYSIEEKVLYLYFDSNYGEMSPEGEVLCRAALAKTLTQINGIDYISVYTGEKPLADSAGNPIGLVSASDFIENISDVNTFEKTDLKLFFADSTGQNLVEEDREVVYSINTSQEKLIIEQLLEGPTSPDMLPTLPSTCKLLNVTVSDNVCYVNFDNAFLSGVGDVKDLVTIYSIVNSLSELPSVSKVQISANGVQNVMLRDTISLNTTFERNLDYVIEQ